jgi:competence protein ComEA
MDLIGEERGRLTRAAVWLQATRAELLGLAVLLTGCVVVTAMVWLSPLAGGGDGERATGGDVGAEVDPLEPTTDDDGAFVDDVDDQPDHGAGHEDSEEELTVHVSGAVVDPGLFQLPAGSRVGDALLAADGAIDEAVLDGLNLAQPLGDGERVHVPLEGEDPPPAAVDGTGSDPGGDPAPVDINRAGVEELERLPGIGPARAQTIVEHREAHGPFGEPGDLRAVSGIGEATFQRLAELITVS